MKKKCPRDPSMSIIGEQDPRIYHSSMTAHSGGEVIPQNQSINQGAVRRRKGCQENIILPQHPSQCNKTKNYIYIF